MLKISSVVPFVGLTLASMLALTACSTPGASPTSSSVAGSGTAERALAAAYEGFEQDVAIDPVMVTEAEQNVAIISCSLTLASCTAQSDAISDAVTAIGWWPMVFDGEGQWGPGSAVRQAIANAATVIVVLNSDCRAVDAIYGEASLAKIPVLAVGGKDDCEPKRFDAVTRWGQDMTATTREIVVGRLQADYAVGVTAGEVKALVLTQAGTASTANIAKGFGQELKALSTGKIAQTIELSAAEIADKSFSAKVVQAAKDSGANVVVAPEDAWVIDGGLGDALLADAKTQKLVVIGHGGGASSLNAIRAGNAGLTATVAQAYDWQGMATVDAVLRMLAGEGQVYFGDTIRVVDADHNMPNSGGFVSNVDVVEKYTAAWILPAPTKTPAPTPRSTN